MITFFGIKRLLVLSGCLTLIIVAAGILHLSFLREETQQSRAIAQAGSYSSKVKGTSAVLGMSGAVEYTLWDARSNVIDHGVISNTVNDQALDAAFDRLFNDTAGLIKGYNAIAALSVAPSYDGPSDGVDAASITLTLDGDSGAPGDQNPAEGIIGVPNDGSGQGTVSVIFTAQGACEVKQLVLTKTSANNTAAGGAVAIPNTDIFSFVDVPDISLNSGDTVAYTWTIDVD